MKSVEMSSEGSSFREGLGALRTDKPPLLLMYSRNMAPQVLALMNDFVAPGVRADRHIEHL